MKIAIIGAGVSGLTMGQLLKSKHDVTLYEKEQTPGGLIRCQRIDGNLFHICGGHVFNTRKQPVLDFFWSKFNKEEEFALTERNSAVVMPQVGYLPYPVENYVYLLPEDMQKSVIADLMQMEAQQAVAPRNFEEFLRKRFGETLYQAYFKPYNQKIWKNNLSNIPLDWLEGKLPMPTVQEIIFNNFNHVKEKQFVHSTFWYEKHDGSQHIANRLAEGLNIVYNAEISNLMHHDGKWNVAGTDYDLVVYCGNIKALPASVNVDLTPWQKQIADLASHGTTSVFCRIDPNPYSWLYLPDGQFDAHRIICTGNFNPSNNAAGEKRITATVEFTDRIDRDQIVEQLSLMPLHPEYITHHYSQYTYPVQSADTRQMILDLKQHLQGQGLFLTGRFADWEYYNMDAAMDAAMKTCKEIENKYE